MERAVDTRIQTEETLDAFYEAHERRMQVLQQGDADADAAIAEEREALCRHADAVRAHAARLAKHGR